MVNYVVLYLPTIVLALRSELLLKYNIHYVSFYLPDGNQ